MIQTVTGAINKIESGAALMHEHISCASVSFVQAFGAAWLDKQQLKDISVEALKRAKEANNLSLLVDGTPIDLGRDALLLKEISQLSGVRIVASTGFYDLPSIEASASSAGEIASWFISECKNGIYGTDVKPGILKCATGSAGITGGNAKKLAAMAITQGETGLPMFVHSGHYGDIAFEQLEILLKNHANIEKIIMGHGDLRPDSDYLESILQKGCYICLDQSHSYARKVNEIADALVKLCQKGYTQKILLSNDHCIHSDFCSRKENGLHLSAREHAEKLGLVFEKLYSAFLCAGGKQLDWDTMIYKNPTSVLNVE